MPELPEVETVRRGLERLVPAPLAVVRVETRRRDLRVPFPRSLAGRLVGQHLRGFRRWGKYLLWDAGTVVMVSHLGMSGTWRAAPAGDEREHDHLYLHLEGGLRLALRDPRRFGLVDLAEPGRERENRWLRDLGPDPLDASAFTGAWLKRALAGRRAPLKALLMDQSLVAGIGNIYAAEALFRAGLRPARAAGKIRVGDLERLVASLREVLLEAIAAGGSTLRDFGNAEGGSGYFQHRFQVYGREGEPCLSCRRALCSTRIGNRATAWCRHCQR